MANVAAMLTKTRVADGICASVAIITTLYRIVARARRGQLWFDDMWAAFSMCSVVLQVIASSLNPDAGIKIVRFYLLITTFYSIIWSARLSILFSLIRIDIKPQRRRVLAFVAASFICTWLVLTAQLYWECESDTLWKKADFPRCNLSRAVVFLQLASDIVSDGILLFVPIRLFTVIRDKRLRYRLMVIFGTCFITTAVSIVHTVYMFEGTVFPIFISSIVENMISLIVCNVPVMVASIFDLQAEHTLPSSPDGMPTLWTLMSATNPVTTSTAVSSCLDKPGSEMSVSQT